MTTAQSAALAQAAVRRDSCIAEAAPPKQFSWRPGGKVPLVVAPVRHQDLARLEGRCGSLRISRPCLRRHHNGAIVRGLEKRKPTYDLGSIQAEFSTVDGLRMTATARNGAFALGLTLQDVVALIQTIRSHHFYKSMTSFADPSVWQDVYRVPHEQVVLYVKFTFDVEGHLVISLKEQ